jgi:molybdate transport system substrate-binding protein
MRVRIARRLLVSLISLVLLTCLAPETIAAADKPGLTIYAASSLGDALQEIGANYSANTGIKVKFNFAASSLLARQIEAGAPADIFISADTDWMDYVQQRKLIVSTSRFNLLSNRLVLVAPAGKPIVFGIRRGFPLDALLGPDGKLAIADPDYVPAGKYAREALTSLGIWTGVANRLIRTENVRVALALVARGEAPLGIVYASDAQAEKRVTIVDMFPASSHAKIIYPAAQVMWSSASQDFLRYLRSPAAKAIFKRNGFIV